MHLQFPVGSRDGKLRILLGKVIWRTEEESRMGLAEHSSIVVRIAGGQDMKIEGLERRHRVFFLIRHPHVVIDNAAG